MSNNEINFTKAALDALAGPSTGRTVYHDAKTTGLQIRVTTTGAKTFSVFRRVKGGAPERVTLGRYPEMSIEQARRKASRVNTEIEEGSNPAAVKRAIRGEIDFDELFTQYLERLAKPGKKSWQDDEARYRLHAKAPLGKKRITQINRNDIALIHSKMTKAGNPTNANRVSSLISSVFGWAIKVGLAESNPARGIQRNKEKSRDRFLQSEELPLFFAALAAEPNETIRDFFMIALLTGARRSNVLAMAWNEISFDRTEWKIPETKNGTSQVVTLTAEAMTLLSERKVQVTGDYVFPGVGKSGHLEEPKKGWKRLLERIAALAFVKALSTGSNVPEIFQAEAEELALTDPEQVYAIYSQIAQENKVDPAKFHVKDLRIHDLRRTLGSWQAITGASLTIIAKSLNQKNLATTQVYARLNQDPVRLSIETAVSAMMKAGSVTQAN